MSVFDDILDDFAKGVASTPLGPVVPFLQSDKGRGAVSKVDDLAKKDTRMKLSELAAEGGFTDTRTATAIALAESSGNPGATNHNTNGTQDTGLWQVNDVHAGIAGSPKDVGEFRKWLKDPHNNAKAAAAVFASQGWAAWTVYKTGAYKKYLGHDKEITTDRNSVVGDVVESVADPLASVGAFFAALGSADTWFRIAKTGLGAFLIVAGAGTLLVIAINKAANTSVGRAVRTVT